jgi:hypothetical protein
MNFFEEATLRLKQQLKVTEDKQAAEFLGLTQGAWTKRKKRGNFPEKELYALAAKRPELELDVLYILTGERQEGLDAMYEAFVLAGVDLKSVGRMVKNDKAYARRLKDCVPIMHTLANCTDEDVQLVRQLVARLRKQPA